MAAHPSVNVRYVVKQSKESTESGLSELNFNGDFTWNLQEVGRQDAVDALNGTNGVNVRDYLAEWTVNSALKERYTKVGDFINARASLARSAAEP